MDFKIDEEQYVNSYSLILSSKKQEYFPSGFCEVNDKVFALAFDDDQSEECVRLSFDNKNFICGVEELESVTLYPYFPLKNLSVDHLQFYLSMSGPKKLKEIVVGELEQHIRKIIGHHFLNQNQNFEFNYKETIMNFRTKIRDNKESAQLSPQTRITFCKEPHQKFQLINDQIQSDSTIEENDYKAKLKRMKVGGLADQINLISRRVFASRGYGTLLNKLGISHTKGILLYGPPGTGKTLLARQISKILDVQPKVVNGPELLDKFVGEGQRKLRALFDEAIREYRERGENSNLHVIIFDEFDAIARQRGSHDNAIGDSLVNQLLTLIDGVDSPKNILIIGMTNRKDLIDDALLRSGRLEVHVEIHLPDQQGREEIINIHTEKMNKNGFLGDDVRSKELAKTTKNYTGAEIQGLVKNAVSFATEECKQKNKKQSEVKICKKHFQMAKTELIPQFGQDEKSLESLKPPKFLISGERYNKSLNSLKMFVNKSRKMKQGRECILISGGAGSGKTALAALAVQELECSFTKLISCDKLYNLTDQQKLNWIIKIFEDSKRCKDSCIILDDLLRLIEYIPMGSRFNNLTLQLLINLLRVVPEKGKKQIIIATATSEEVLANLGLSELFEMKLVLPTLDESEIQQFLIEQGFDKKFSKAASVNLKNASMRKLVKIHGYSGFDEEEWCNYQKAMTE